MWVTLQQKSFSLSTYVPWKKSIDKGEAGSQPSSTSSRDSSLFRALPRGLSFMIMFYCWVPGHHQSGSKSESHRLFIAVFWDVSNIPPTLRTVLPPSTHRGWSQQPCIYYTTLSLWPQQYGPGSGTWHNQFVSPGNFKLRLKLPSWIWVDLLDRGDIKPQNLASILKINK